MLRYIMRRLLLVAVSASGVCVAVFLLVRFIPGDVAVVYMGDSFQPDRAPVIRQQLGLDLPLHQQFGLWVRNVVTGRWNSFFSGRSVFEELAERVPVSAELAGLGLAFALLIAFPLGVLSAVRATPVIDHSSRILAVLGLSVPNFWAALLLVLLLVSVFQWVPPLLYVSPSEDLWQNLQQMFFPALIVGFETAAGIMRVLRTSLLEVLRSDYIRTAWAKGLRERSVIARHALKNAMAPVLTVIGLDVGRLVGGLVIVEMVFVVPGAGRFIVQSIMQRDYPQIQANIILIALLFLLVNLFVDLAYAWLDPRIRY
ncbi:MAG: ABC transporter permease [Chloroflexi bacterium]|nr:ABC transporter permease [Chloroflexota bacterium]